MTGKNMTEQEILTRFSEAGALLEGHFLLRSGMHSDRFFQAALVLQYTAVASELCTELARRVGDLKVDTVMSPAIGGIVVGQEVGRALGVRAIFAEKASDTELVLRRGFSVKPGERVLIAEDVVTKGGRVQQTIDLVRELGAEAVGVAVLVDRSRGAVSFGVPFFSLLPLELNTYPADDCPLCVGGSKAEKPGS